MQKVFHMITFFSGLLFLCACTSLPGPSIYESSSQNEIGAYELIIAKETEILDAASGAIHISFPNATISYAGGKEKGFVFSRENSSGNPQYKFIIEKSYGTVPEGNDIVGYRYFIYANEKLLSPESYDAQTLATEFRKILADRGMEIVRVQRIKRGGAQ